MNTTPINLKRLKTWFEHSRKDIESEFAKKAADAENLTSWGAALLQLSQMGYTIEVSEKMNKDAIKKLGKAVEMDPANHEALWWLGSAHSALAFLTPDLNKATTDFDKAFECYQKADQLCPGQNHYIKSLRRCSSGHNREWHALMHGGSSSAKGIARNKKSGSKYEIYGWATLAVGLVAWIAMAISNVPPLTSR